MLKVEVAVPVCAKLSTERPPEKVEVAVVVAINRAATTSPTTESFAYGDVVPIPTRPRFNTIVLR